MGLPTQSVRRIRRWSLPWPLVPVLALVTSSGCFFLDRVSLPDGPRGSGRSEAVAVDENAFLPEVAFQSDATHLVPGDTNGTTDVFFTAGTGGHTELMSQASDGTRANGPSQDPTIDSRNVAFESSATNLAGPDGNGVPDIYVRSFGSSREFFFTARVSVDATGGDPDGASRDPSFGRRGQFVAFASDATDLLPSGPDTNGVADVFVRDRDVNGNGLLDQPGDAVTSRVSVAADGGQADGPSAHPSMSYYFDPSPGGNLVAFDSEATNLIPGAPDTNGVSDIYVRDTGAGTTTRISVAHDGGDPNERSHDPSIRFGGRYVAFASAASNLVPGDHNGVTDVFVRDLQTDTTTRVSVAADGAEADGPSGKPSLSTDGRVAFESWATNLVPGDTNQAGDVFVRDPSAGTTRLFSSGPGGVPGNNTSEAPAFGSFGGSAYVAFESLASNLGEDPSNGDDVFWRLNPGTVVTALDTPAENTDPQVLVLDMSADGRYVAFSSDSRSVVPPDSLARSVYVRDTRLGRTERVSLGAAGQLADSAGDDGAISGDGNVVAFVSFDRLTPDDTELFGDVYVRDRAAATTQLVSIPPPGIDIHDWHCRRPSLSADGRKVAFDCSSPGTIMDPDGITWVFVRDRAAGTTSVVTQLDTGPHQAEISADGRYVTFISPAAQVPGDGNFANDIFVRDLVTSTTSLVSVTTAGAQGNSDSLDPDISADGRFVVFMSIATNFVAGDTFGSADVFVHDRDADADGIFDEPGARTTTLADVTSAGGRAGDSFEPAISGDGRLVAFTSDAAGVVPGDDNGTRDAFVRDRASQTTTRVSTNALGAGGSGRTTQPRLSGDGHYVAFTSESGDLVDGDRNRTNDVFITAAARPRVALVAPGSLARGATAVVTITGTGFLPDAVVGVSGTGVAVSAVTVTPNQITATLTVAAGAAPGGRTVSVTNPGTGPGVGADTQCGNCLTIT